MIPIRVGAQTREKMVKRVIAEYESATEDQLHRGSEWYQVAHEVADMLADGDIRQGAALLAAFSPQSEWPLNVRLASSAYETGSPRGHTSDVIGKANKILAGLDPQDVLPMDKKTGNFFRCILDPNDPDAVCIDRHAHDIAVGQAYRNRPRGLSAKGRYALFAHVYREAAMRLGKLPQVVQATTWITWKERH